MSVTYCASCKCLVCPEEAHSHGDQRNAANVSGEVWCKLCCPRCLSVPRTRYGFPRVLRAGVRR